jgi:hypothetical protein
MNTGREEWTVNTRNEYLKEIRFNFPSRTALLTLCTTTGREECVIRRHSLFSRLYSVVMNEWMNEWMNERTNGVWSSGGMILSGDNRSTRKKTVPVSLCPTEWGVRATDTARPQSRRFYTETHNRNLDGTNGAHAPYAVYLGGHNLKV